MARDGSCGRVGLFGINGGLRRHEPRDNPATPTNDELFPGLGQIEQLSQLVPGLGGSDLAHDAPQSRGNRQVFY